MPKRRIDPATGEPGLTERELRFIDEYTNNGGNAAQAAAAAGYGAARAGQSAYQVLHRPEVDRRIRERIAQSRVCPDELIGTLASIMHGSLGQCYDESGKFSILVAKQNGVDHLIKSISETTRTIEATKTTPAQVVKTYSVQIHSPIQATTALARILGVNPKTLSRRPLPTDPRPLTPDPCQVITAEFNPLVWLDDLISKQMTESGLSRSEVIDNLIQTRPEIAKYVLDLEKARTPNPFDDLTMRQATKQLDLILDSLIALAQSTPTDPDTPGNPPPDSGPETPDPPLTQDSRPTPDSPESMFSSDPAPAPDSGLRAQDPFESMFPSDPVPAPDSGLATPDSPESMFSSDPVGPQASLPASEASTSAPSQGPVPLPLGSASEKSQPLSMFSPDPVPTPDCLESMFPSHPVPTPDSRLQTQDSRESMFSPDLVPRAPRVKTRDSRLETLGRLRTRCQLATCDSSANSMMTP